MNEETKRGKSMREGEVPPISVFYSMSLLLVDELRRSYPTLLLSSLCACAITKLADLLKECCSRDIKGSRSS